jgi:outer membrane cobalamin receptor
MSIRDRLLASTIICGALSMGAANGAVAQTTTPAAGPAVQEVVVTGTRLRSPNLTSVSPITAVSAEEFKLTGAADVIDTLNPRHRPHPGARGRQADDARRPDPGRRGGRP